MALLTLEQASAHDCRALLACPGDTPLSREAESRGFTVLPFEFRAMRHTFNPLVVAKYAWSVAVLRRRLTGECRRLGVDLLHAYRPIAGLYAVGPARRLGLPLLLHLQDAQSPRSLRALVMKLVGRRATRFICASEAVRAMALRLGYPADRTVLIYNAVDERFLEPTPAGVDAVTGPGPHIGLFAHIHPWKGQAVFLAAAARLADRFPSARFYLVGGITNGVPASYIEELRRRADSAPLAGRVTIAGEQPDIARWMASMDVSVHASTETEAFGIVIAEAMALGRTVVASDVGGPREIIRDGETGYLVPPADPDALAATLARVLDRPDPELGRRAAQTVRERFSPAAFGAALDELYTETLARRGAA